MPDLPSAVENMLQLPLVAAEEPPEEPAPAKTLAYGGNDETLVAVNLFRIERGTEFRRAGKLIKPLAQFASQPVYTKIATSAVTSQGFIDPSQPGLLQIGSVVPGSTTITFTLTFTEAPSTGIWQALITWPTSPIRRANSTSVSVPAGRIQIDGLASSTTYKLYPFLMDNGTGIVGWASQTSGSNAAVGSPAIAHTALSGIALALQNLQNRLSLDVLSFTTPASGAGSGSSSGGPGDGGGCPIVGTQIELLGDSPHTAIIQPQSEWTYVSTENSYKLIATPDHPVFSERHGYRQLQQLQRGEPVITKDGISPVRTVERLVKDDAKIVLSMERGHLFWAGGILSHNLKKL